MVEDLKIINDYSLLKRRKNVICCSKDYVRKASKLLIRADFDIEKIYCDDEILDGELQNIQKAMFSDVFILNDIEKYNVIYAENDQNRMEWNLSQLDCGRKRHIYTYCGLYIAISINADKNNDILKDMACMNDLNATIGSHDFAAKWLRGIRWVEESGIELLLYAMPKTGTQAMKATLNQYGLEHVYIHFLNLDTMINRQMYTFYNDKISCLSKLLDNPEFVKKNYLNVLKNKKIKIITSIREPIARNYSLIFQSIKNWGLYTLIKNENNSFRQSIIDYLDFCSDSSWEWFDDEIKKIFGVDIFQYPFEIEKGYCRIQKDNIDIFLYRLESSKNLGKALGEFLNTSDINILTCHEAKKEEYRFVYEQLKHELHIPEVILSKYYDNEKMRHFYNEEEITELKNKWK